MARKKLKLKISQKYLYLAVIVLFLSCAILLWSNLELRFSQLPPESLPVSSPTASVTKTEADIGEPASFSDGLTLVIEDVWIIKSDLKKLGLEVWRGGNPASFDSEKNLLIISVLFENRNKALPLRYDTRGFELNDENGFSQNDIMGGTKNQQRISRYLPQFKTIDQQRKLLAGQKTGGVILFEVNPSSGFYTLVHRYKSQIVEIIIQNPQIINL